MKISDRSDGIKQYIKLKPSQFIEGRWKFTFDGKIVLLDDSEILFTAEKSTAVQILALLNLDEIESLHIQDTTDYNTEN